MKLKEWLKKNKMPVIEFSEMLYTNRSTVYHWLNGKYRPNPHFTKLVENVTEGAVKEKDWRKA